MLNTTSPAREAAAAVLAMINAKPRTPSIAEIEAAIEGAIERALMTADERIGEGTVTGGGPGEPITSVEFGPVLGPDGEPPDFGFGNREFADLFCPYIRIAFAMIGRDRAGVEKFVRGLATNDPDARPVFQILEAWDCIEGKFGAIAGIAQGAWARVMAVAETVEGEDSDAGRALSAGADKYLDALDKRGRTKAPRVDELGRGDAGAMYSALSGPEQGEGDAGTTL